MSVNSTQTTHITPVTQQEVAQNWKTICHTSDLVANAGICALVREQQVAIFYLPEDNSVFAIDNYDPIGKANVLSRGLIAAHGDELVVASPLYKQHFCLRTGRCLTEDQYSIRSWPARITGTQVEVSAP